MNIIISSGPPNNVGKVILNSTYESGISIAETLNYSSYTLGITQDPIIVNNSSGKGFRVTLIDSGVTSSYLVFDTNETAVLSWISTNHPNAQISNFAKTILTLQ